jgi:hypothetical protein
VCDVGVCYLLLLRVQPAVSHSVARPLILPLLGFAAAGLTRRCMTLWSRWRTASMQASCA